MEDEKKKKKNKKKKNKQSKTTGDVTDGIGESANADQSHAIEQNHHNQLLESADVQNDMQKTDVDLDSCHANGTEGASLEEMIKKLQKENDNCIQKEEIKMEFTGRNRLDKTSVQLYKLHAGIEEAIEKLQNENEAHILEEARLEETIKKLQKENDTHMQKEVGFVEKINQLMDETSTLSLKRVSLEEKIKQLEGEIDYWFQKENSTEETIAKLNGDNTRLQAQVMESEESRNNLLQENQRLIESMYGMKFRIQNLETASTRTSTVMTMHASESEDMNVQTKAAQPLVENFVAKNSELVEKVNELYVELEGRVVPANPSPAVGTEQTVEIFETIHVPDPMLEFIEKTPSGDRMDSHEDVINDDNAYSKDTVCVADSMSELSERVEFPEDVSIKHEGEDGEYNYYAEDTTVIPNSPKAINSEEIVQIASDENEVRDPEFETIHSDAKTDVPITDAPLIGAPFRLISFFARYVSGADLVNKGTVNCVGH
ncbi:hypothetical protein HYC85_022277 [Camellia sinensis]|uniref:Uncharacterized protein n=1 Tax=Camellia sinensis TaxID=4442 RepID=A0A7J7GKB4_CAMSI|nr:hypothetical protein HYC85_022277 [Camellia sinensis]